MRVLKSPRGRLAAVAAAAALLAAAVVPAASASAGGGVSPAASTTASTATVTAPALGVNSGPAPTHRWHGAGAAKPTIVLEHGAWADGSSWNAVITKLERHGYPVLASPNPLRGVAADSEYLRQFLATIAGPIVLVGHSYGGFVITNAATGNTNIKALVYIDAFIPDQGQTVGGITAGSGSALEPALVDPTSVFTLRPFPNAPAGVVDSYLLPKVVEDSFAQDLPKREAALITATQLPAATNVLGEPSGVPAWKTIPSWALIGTKDKIITPATQLAMAKHAGATISTVRASHVSLISQPGVVAKLIIAAANATD